MLRGFCARAAAPGRRWRSGWAVTFQGGRRIFTSVDGKNDVYGEQWHPDDDSKGYYFRLKDGRPIGDSMNEDGLPFKPNDVTPWKLVKGGVQWQNDDPWMRHFDTDQDPFYVHPDGRREWNPQPPPPKKESVPMYWKPTKGSGSTQASEAQAMPRAHETPQAVSQQRPTPRRSKPIAERQADNVRIFFENLEKRAPNVAKAKRYSTFDPVPLSQNESVKVGSLVHLIDDLPVLLARTAAHSAVPEKEKTERALRSLALSHQRVFTLTRWSLSDVASAGPGGVTVLLTSGTAATTERMWREFDNWKQRIRNLKDACRKENEAALKEGKEPRELGNVPKAPPTPQTFWVPASCIVEDGKGFHAASKDCPVSDCGYDAGSAGKTKLYEHLLRAHGTTYKKCRKCGYVCHVSQISEHEEACQTDTSSFLGTAAKKALTDGKDAKKEEASGKKEANKNEEANDEAKEATKEEAGESKDTAAEEVADELDGKTKDALQSMAKELGIKQNGTKAELVKRIREAEKEKAESK